MIHIEGCSIEPKWRWIDSIHPKKDVIKLMINISCISEKKINSDWCSSSWQRKMNDARNSYIRIVLCLWWRFVAIRIFCYCCRWNRCCSCCCSSGINCSFSKHKNKVSFPYIRFGLPVGFPKINHWLIEFICKVNGHKLNKMSL